MSNYFPGFYTYHIICPNIKHVACTDSLDFNSTEICSGEHRGCFLIEWWEHHWLCSTTIGILAIHATFWDSATLLSKSAKFTKLWLYFKTYIGNLICHYHKENTPNSWNYVNCTDVASCLRLYKICMSICECLQAKISALIMLDIQTTRKGKPISKPRVMPLSFQI